MNTRDFQWQGPRIRSWASFHRLVRRSGQPLLACLDAYPDSVLVAGCQRSGTTAVARLLQKAEGVTDIRFCHDEELAAALLLSGRVSCRRPGRYCFQTTYLNERVGEYLEHDGFRLLWLIREPDSVIYSMLNNWKSSALNRLYETCGRGHIDTVGEVRRILGPSRLQKACASYVAKAEQAFLLKQALGDRMMVVDYDDLVLHKASILPEIFRFAGLQMSAGLEEKLHGKSLSRGARFPERIAGLIRQTCHSTYTASRELRTLEV